MLGDLRLDAAGIGDQLTGFGPHLLLGAGQRLGTREAGGLVAKLIGFLISRRATATSG